MNVVERLAELKETQQSNTVLPNGMSIPDQPQLMAQEQANKKKLENQKKMEELRAKLMANRHNTPLPANTPTKAAPQQEKSLDTAVSQTAEKAPKKEADETDNEQPVQLDDNLSNLDDYLASQAQSKAAAERSVKSTVTAAPQPVQTAMSEMAPVQQSQSQPQPPQQEQKQQYQEAQQQAPTALTNAQAVAPTNLIDPYYADLSIWLEVTGFHDAAYRNSKLRTYKERKSLEEEAARIQERLEKLRQTEQAENEAMRSSSLYPRATSTRPPPLPAAMPAADGGEPVAKKPAVNGTKRAHSPEPIQAARQARRREDSRSGFRVRGANNSPDNNPPVAFRGRAASPVANGERRVSYPDAREPGLHRRNSFGEPRGRLPRDPSLERRQSYYLRDGEGGPPPRDRERGRFDDTYPPREIGGRDRMGYGGAATGRELFRGNRTLDLRNGGKK